MLTSGYTLAPEPIRPWGSLFQSDPLCQVLCGLASPTFLCSSPPATLCWAPASLPLQTLLIISVFNACVL